MAHDDVHLNFDFVSTDVAGRSLGPRYPPLVGRDPGVAAAWGGGAVGVGDGVDGGASRAEGVERKVPL